MNRLGARKIFKREIWVNVFFGGIHGKYTNVLLFYKISHQFFLLSIIVSLLKIRIQSINQFIYMIILSD